MVPSLRSGELATRPLPGLLLDLHEGGVSGSLTLRRAGMVKTIELAGGALVRVVSSMRDETLGHFLVRRGSITERQHRAAVEQAAKGGGKLGESLIALGVLNSSQLAEVLAEQDRHKLVSALRWPQGSWRFDGHPAGPALPGAAMPELVLRGLRDTGELEVDRLRRFDGGVVELSPRGRSLGPLVRELFGAQVFEALGRGGAVAVIERACGDRLLARRALDALVLCGGAALHRPRGSVAVGVEVSSPQVTQGEASLPRGVAPRRSDPAIRGATPGRGVVVAPAMVVPAAPVEAASGAVEAVAPERTVSVAAPRAPSGPIPSIFRKEERGGGPPLAAASPRSAHGGPPVAPGPVAGGEQVGAATASSRAPTRREVWIPGPGTAEVAAIAPRAGTAEVAAIAPRAGTAEVAAIAPRAGTAEVAAIAPRTITSAARSRTWTPWSSVPARTATNPLYDLLFDEPHAVPAEGSSPLMLFEGDSGVVTAEELGTVNEHGEEAAEARRALVAEAERIRTADLYTALMVERTASTEEIAAALSERQRAFSRDYYARFGLGLDRPRLEEVLAIYSGARNILLDDDARRAYDRALGEAEAAGVHTLDAEAAFRQAEDLLQQHRYPEAIAQLEGLTARAPAQADFHEVLGWTHWLDKGPSARAGDLARPHLNRALEIDPEHVAAHVHRAIIGAALGEDDAEVVFHLERALDLAPARVEALEQLEAILLRRGELRRLERVYKRLLFRLSQVFARRAAEIWLALAQLYAQQLDDPAAAQIAAGNAEALAGDDLLISSAVARLREAAARPRHPLEPARARLRKTRELEAAVALFRSAGEVGQPDSALVTAATMVALGTADGKLKQTYERHRVQHPVLPEQPLTPQQWALLRHPDDLGELETLLELVAPVVAQLSPVTLAAAGVERVMRVTDDELPAPFLRVRAQLARVFEVEPPWVYARPELERRIELVATDAPVLVAGDEALTAPERPELVCRLARAMCHARLGRAVGGSRSGRVLRAVVLAMVRDATSASVGEQEPLAAAATAQLAQLAPATRSAARAATLRLLARASSINLSGWSRSLPRTADRAGLLLCQDIPTALAIAKEGGVLDRELVEFAFGAEHVALREALGLAVCG